LRILALGDLATAGLSEVAYFDIYPSSNSAKFNGAWSTYPYFPSGIVVVSGIEQGLFVLLPDLSGTPPPSDDKPDAPDGLSAQNNGDGSASITFDDLSNNETGFELQREKQHKKRGWVNTTTLSLDSDNESYTDASGSGTFQYRIRAVNNSGASDWTGWIEITVTAIRGGGSTKCHPRRGCDT